MDEDDVEASGRQGRELARRVGGLGAVAGTVGHCNVRKFAGQEPGDRLLGALRAGAPSGADYGSFTPGRDKMRCCADS